VAAHPSRSGIYPLRDARDAFAARVLLASHAHRTLDAQYYIWRNDVTGALLFKALRDAADRGVRVRLLLDDNNTGGLDRTLAALDAHPNLEVRLFNPFSVRRPHWLGYLTDFRRLNHRMHNKSFTVDNEVTIVGGRNVGDEYFGAAMAGVLFSDLDVMAAGAVVRDVSNEFERYWNSASACPIERVMPRATSAEFTQLVAKLEAVERSSEAAAYLSAIRELPFVHRIAGGTLEMEWVPVRIISDDPAKILGRAAKKSLLIEKLKRIFGDPEKRIDLISPYFVPGTTGTDLLRRWSGSGVMVNILTNSLEATDVAAVHAGYAKRRRALLQGGIHLYELRRSARIAQRKAGPLGSSSSSLHAKTFAVDHCRVFVGSFNLDPRSARLNTEMGFVIDSPRLAGEIEKVFEVTIPASAYRVHLSPAGRLYWTDQTRRYRSEPGSSFARRTAVWLSSKLPIEWLL
jgi:putative cardiolipin synthase